MGQKQIKISVTEQMNKNIEKICKITGMKKSELGRHALNEYIMRHIDKIK